MRLGQGAYRIQSAIYQTSTVVLCADDGGAFVVDPGYFPQELERIRRLVRRAADGAVRLVLTHSDFDHVMGTYALSPAPIVASELWDRHNETRQLRLARDFDEEHLVVRPRGAFAPRPVHVPVGKDGILLHGLRLHLAPGHTRDGLVGYHGSSGCLVLGDYLSPIEFPEVAYDLAAYADTLALIAGLASSLPVRAAVPGHGLPYHDLSRLEAALRRDAAYLYALLDAALTWPTADDLPERTRSALRPYGPYGPQERFFGRHRDNVRHALALAARPDARSVAARLEDLASGRWRGTDRGVY